jgi:hypothetical protein
MSILHPSVLIEPYKMQKKMVSGAEHVPYIYCTKLSIMRYKFEKQKLYQRWDGTRNREAFLELSWVPKTNAWLRIRTGGELF